MAAGRRTGTRQRGGLKAEPEHVRKEYKLRKKAFFDKARLELREEGKDLDPDAVRIRADVLAKRVAAAAGKDKSKFHRWGAPDY